MLDGCLIYESVWTRERMCVCVCEREKDKARETEIDKWGCLCIWVWETVRERGGERGEREREEGADQLKGKE